MFRMFGNQTKLELHAQGRVILQVWQNDISGSEDHGMHYHFWGNLFTVARMQLCETKLTKTVLQCRA